MSFENEKCTKDVCFKNVFSIVTGLPPCSGGVAHALGPWQRTNNSAGLLDMKYVDNLFSAMFYTGSAVSQTSIASVYK